MDSTLFLQNITLEDFQEIVSQTVRREVTAALAGLRQPAPKATKLVPRKEAARHLGVSLTTIDNWAKVGILRAIKKGGRIYFQENELNK